VLLLVHDRHLFVPRLRLHLFFVDVMPHHVIYTLSLHDALPIYATSSRSSRFPYFRQWAANMKGSSPRLRMNVFATGSKRPVLKRWEEHTSELQSRGHLVCRLLPGKKKAWNSQWMKVSGS